MIAEIYDDFGIEKVMLEYYLIKPYYLEQDTILYQEPIIMPGDNKTAKYINYDWNKVNINLNPGDELFYYIKAYDNNIKTGPGIGKSDILRAYFPNLEELYFEVEEQQDQVVDTFDNMMDSLDELKDMYEEITNDVLKEETGWEQEKEASKMVQELENISEKIESLDNTIKTIKELNEKNNLINSELGEKIEKLRKMFQDAISPELMESLRKLQESLSKNNFQESVQELNNFEFEMNDLERQLDRMIE
ncbi:uncharacterized protein METZ01_LOCUS345131, partial [marine metagenome]